MYNYFNFYKKINRESLYLFIILLFGLVLRVYSMRANPVINVDGILYIEQAKAIWDGRFNDILTCYHYPNLYSLLVALLYPITGDWIVTGRSISLLSWVAATYYSWKIARLTGLETPVLLLAFIYVVSVPDLVLYSYGALRDPISWAFCMAAMYYLIDFFRDKEKLSQLMKAEAAFLGASFARYEYMAFVFISGLFYLYNAIERKALRHLFFISFVIISISFMVILNYEPVMLYIIGPIKDKLSIKLASYVLLRDSLRDLATMNEIGQLVANHYFFDEIRNLLWWNAIGLLVKKLFDTLRPAGFIFFILGILYFIKRDMERNGKIFLDKYNKTAFNIPLIFILVILIIFYGQAIFLWAITKRHICILLFLAISFIAAGIRYLYILIVEKAGASKAYALAFILLFIALSTVPSDLNRCKRASKVELMEIGKEIASLDMFYMGGEGRRSGPIRIAGSIKRINLINFYANLDKNGNTCFDKALYIDGDERERQRKAASVSFDYYLWDKKNGPEDILLRTAHYGLKKVSEFRSDRYGRLILFKRL